MIGTAAIAFWGVCPGVLCAGCCFASSFLLCSSGAVGPQYQPKSAALAHGALPCSGTSGSGGRCYSKSWLFSTPVGSSSRWNGRKSTPCLCAVPIFGFPPAQNSKAKGGKRRDCVFQQEGCPAAERLKNQYFKCAFRQNEIYFILIFRCASLLSAEKLRLKCWFFCRKSDGQLSCGQIQPLRLSSLVFEFKQ